MFVKSDSNVFFNLFSVCLFTTLIMFSSNKAHAVIAPDACDTEYYNTMKEKAWMEVQREIESNNHYIWRPDSVLQYTCFNNLAYAFLSDGNLFSYDRTRSGTAFPLTDPMTAIKSVMDSYITQQEFDQSVHNSGAGASNAGSNNAGYTCAIMRDAWKSSKCEANPNNNFYSLFELYGDPDGSDLTQLKGPANLTCDKDAGPGDMSQAPDDAAGWTAAYERATDLQNGTATPIANYFDVINAQFNLWLALDETNPAGGTISVCADPIPTGVLIRTNEMADGYFDAICPNTGCSMTVAIDANRGTVTCCNSTGTGSTCSGDLGPP